MLPVSGDCRPPHAAWLYRIHLAPHVCRFGSPRRFDFDDFVFYAHRNAKRYAKRGVAHACKRKNRVYLICLYHNAVCMRACVCELSHSSSIFHVFFLMQAYESARWHQTPNVLGPTADTRRFPTTRYRVHTLRIRMLMTPSQPLPSPRDDYCRTVTDRRILL